MRSSLGMSAQDIRNRLRPPSLRWQRRSARTTGLRARRGNSASRRQGRPARRSSIGMSAQDMRRKNAAIQTRRDCRVERHPGIYISAEKRPKNFLGRVIESASHVAQKCVGQSLLLSPTYLQLVEGHKSIGDEGRINFPLGPFQKAKTPVCVASRRKTHHALAVTGRRTGRRLRAPNAHLGAHREQ